MAILGRPAARGLTCISALSLGACLLVASRRTFDGADSARYDVLAHNLLAGHYSACHAAPYLPEIERMPGYPALLAGVYALVGDSPFAVAAAQALLHALTIPLVWWIAREMTQRRAVAWLAAAAWAFDPFAIYYACGRWAEYPSAALSIAALAGMLAHSREPERWSLAMILMRRRQRWALAGGALAAAAAVYVRPNLVIVPFALLAVALVRRAAPRLRRGLAITCAVVAVSLAPWVARNASTFGRPMIAHQWLWQNVCEGVISLQNLPAEQVTTMCRPPGFLDECDARVTRAEDAPMRAAAIGFVEAHPLAVAGAALVKPLKIWVSARVTDNQPGLVSAAAPVMRFVSLALLPAFLWGAWRLWRTHEHGFVVGAWCAALSSVHVVMAASARYGFPGRALYWIAVGYAGVLLWEWAQPRVLAMARAPGRWRERERQLEVRVHLLEARLIALENERSMRVPHDASTTSQTSVS